MCTNSVHQVRQMQTLQTLQTWCTGWSVDWGQYTDDGSLARAYVEEPAASAWPPVIVTFF